MENKPWENHLTHGSAKNTEISQFPTGSQIKDREEFGKSYLPAYVLDKISVEDLPYLNQRRDGTRDFQMDTGSVRRNGRELRNSDDLPAYRVDNKKIKDQSYLVDDRDEARNDSYNWQMETGSGVRGIREFRNSDDVTAYRVDNRKIKDQSYLDNDRDEARNDSYNWQMDTRSGVRHSREFRNRDVDGYGYDINKSMDVRNMNYQVGRVRNDRGSWQMDTESNVPRGNRSYNDRNVDLGMEQKDDYHRQTTNLGESSKDIRRREAMDGDGNTERLKDRSSIRLDHKENPLNEEYYWRWVYAGEDPSGALADYNDPQRWPFSRPRDGGSINREDILKTIQRPTSRDGYFR